MPPRVVITGTTSKITGDKLIQKAHNVLDLAEKFHHNVGEEYVEIDAESLRKKSAGKIVNELVERQKANNPEKG